MTMASLVRAWAIATPLAPALVDVNGATMTFGRLWEAVEAGAAQLGLPHRSLVVLDGDRSIDTIVMYLALHEAGHVPLLAGGHVDDLVEAWAPGALIRVERGHAEIHRCAGQHNLHPDLALLLSTSGSTGASKLVRLSHANLVSNASAIAGFLALTVDDRSITSLPLHYCYGLSVLHSHLAVGASVVVSPASVVDPCFRDAMTLHGVTNLAGVPHTYELLERTGFDPADHPYLRLMTQAGGRMAPERVRRWAVATRRAGAELFVMYGQTEATARMAFVPPELIEEQPFAIGVPIPGGSLRLRPHPDAPHGSAGADGEVGELVYTGPNVMMGYAQVADDLAAGAGPDELPTGDLARFHPESGLFEIVGRAARFVKPFGVRIELDQVEQHLSRFGWQAAVTGDDHHLAVVVVDADPDEVRTSLATFTALPIGSLRVVAADSLPRTAAGKIDHPAVLAMAAENAADLRPAGNAANAPGTTSVTAVFAEVLGRDVGEDDTFVSLGGDSLSYVECSMRLEQVIGTVPAGWHLRPVRELSRLRPSGARPAVDTTVVLRALSICTVLATHMHLRRFPGGAHLLLAVAGYNFARFQLSVTDGRQRLRSGLRTVVRFGGPAAIWIALNMVLTGRYSLGSALLVNNYTGSSWRREGRWEYWFFEVLVQIVVVVSLLLAVPAVRRAERRAPFAFALALLMPLLVFRFGWWQLGDQYNYLFRTHTVAWFFVLGWLASLARRSAQRWLVSALLLVAVPTFFDRPQREWFILVGLLVLVWVPMLPLPRVLHRPIGTIAAASMWIFLLHWQVWPPLDAVLIREVAYVLTLAVGVSAWAVVRLVPRATAAARRRVATDGWTAAFERSISRPPGRLTRTPAR